jgi:hypothetical protein
MADVSITHAKVSAKSDTADTTLVQPSDWNDGHAMSGGTHGDIPLRDTGATDGASYLASVAKGQMVVSDGVAAKPKYSGAAGASGTVWTSNGAGADPSWQANVVANQFSGVAGETLAVGDVCYCVVTGFGTAGRMYKTTAYPWLSRIRTMGGPFIALSTGNAGDTVTFASPGTVAGLSGLTANTMYWISPTSPGAMTATEPSAGWNRTPLPLGVAYSTTGFSLRGWSPQLALRRKAIYGYAAGGYTGAVSTACHRMTFSTGAWAAWTAGNLANAVYGQYGGLSDLEYYGHMAGGWDGGSANQYAWRLTLATGAMASNTAAGYPVAGGSQGGANINNSSHLNDGQAYGYWLDGSSAYQLTYATCVWASKTTAKCASGAAFAHISDGLIYGYPTYGTTGYRMTFATATTAANTAAALSVAAVSGNFCASDPTYGFVCGGHSGAHVTTGHKMTFSTGVMAANTASNLSVARYALSSVSDGQVYAYGCGGAGTAGWLTTADRLTFSTGAVAANTASDFAAYRGLTGGINDYAI